jgi:phosphate/sulfate permease
MPVSTARATEGGEVIAGHGTGQSKRAIKKRPSVSLMMTYLSVAFLGFWIAALAFAIHRNWP